VLAKKREETRVLERPVGPHCLVTPCLQGPGDLSIPSLCVQPPCPASPHHMAGGLIKTIGYSHPD
jgi:hypothetical protein